MIQRNERLSRAMKGGDTQTPDDDAEKSAENENESEAKPDAASESESASKEKEETASPTVKAINDDPLKSLDLQIVEWNQKLVSENKNLHQVRTGSMICFRSIFCGVKCRDHSQRACHLNKPKVTCC